MDENLKQILTSTSWVAPKSIEYVIDYGQYNQPDIDEFGKLTNSNSWVTNWYYHEIIPTPRHILSENCIDISLPGVTKKEIKKLQIVNGDSLVVDIDTDSLFVQSGEYTYDLENKFKLNGEACLENGILSVIFKPVYQTKDIEIIEYTPS